MNNKQIIFLLFISIIASGCASSGNSSEGISVTEFNVEPSQVFSGSSTSVSLNIVNSGLLEAEVISGENGNQILTNHCTDIFDITEYRASSSQTAETSSSYTLSSNEEARFYWRLEQTNPNEVPLQGFRCNLKMEIPFDYSVNAFKQIQFKQNRDVEGSPNLETKVSDGPLKVVMRIVGSTAQQPDTVLVQDNASAYITVENTDSSDSPYQGLIELNSIEVNSTDNIDLQDDCGGTESATLSTGSQKVYKCNIEPGEIDSPSIRGEINVQADYTFVKDLGSQKVQVKNRGN